MNDRRLQQEAERIVAEALQALPPILRERAERVPVVFLPVPDDEIAEALGDDLLGLFEGEPTDVDDVPMASRIFLFYANIADYAEDEGNTYAEEVERTYLHELGHLFGWGEDDLAERDLD
ncbi:MAG: metallopeptidase family protein [Verrucomicrobiota bacterium JB022]|nr:metallopeptidase family protein [Verrucomicrobiota bacterium JB022]